MACLIYAVCRIFFVVYAFFSCQIGIPKISEFTKKYFSPSLQMAPMDSNGSKQLQIAQDGSKIALYAPKLVQMGPNGPKQVEMGPSRSKQVQAGQNRSKIIKRKGQNGGKMSKMSQNHCSPLQKQKKNNQYNLYSNYSLSLIFRTPGFPFKKKQR